MEHSIVRIKMSALARRANSILRPLLGISGFLLAVCLCKSAPLPQQGAVPASAILDLKSRAESGDPSARDQLKEFLVSADPASPGYDQALSWLQFSASQNAPDALYRLGYLYEHGRGLSRDFAKAAENYRNAALQGYAPAENNLGALYQRGYGVPRDISLAFHWYSLAAQHGSPVAEQNLGTLYFLGQNTHADYVQAAKWFRASAEHGLAQGQSSLAFCYLKGIGVSPDDSQAAHWARLAAEQGHPHAEALLAFLYEHGKGLPLDYVSAYAWYSRAIADGDLSDADRLKSLSKVMTAKQLEVAKSLVSVQSLAPRPAATPSISVARSLFSDQ
jgi:uncharacterized protein